MPVDPNQVYIGSSYLNDHTDEKVTILEIEEHPDEIAAGKTLKVVVTDDPDAIRWDLDQFTRNHSRAWR